MSRRERPSSALRGLLSGGRRETPPQGAGPPPSERGGTGGLWFGVLGGPTAWLAAFLVNVFLIRGSCLPAAVTARYALVGAAGIVAIAASLLAFRAWRTLRTDAEPGSGGAVGRDRFLSVAGIGWSGISIVLVIALLTTIVFLDPCIQALGGARL